jgi:asparagine synthetase B (glutamine-hydrolysing)
VPGIWGATGALAAERSRLERELADVWENVQSVRRPDGRSVCGHSFGPACVGSTDAGSLWAIDGEVGAYRAVPADGDAPPGGNVAWLHADGSAVLRADDAGAFPLYYAATPQGMVFSSLLRPLARALGASPDPVGIAQFLRFAFTYQGRTVFAGIRRVAPGQLVRWDPRSGLGIEERARAWIGVATELGTPEDAAEAVAPVLRSALKSTLGSGEALLMMSAGWDSRTLLCGVEREGEATLTGYCHGDLSSRELALARDMCARVGVPFRSRAIGPDVWSLDHLERSFRRTECLLFPHWSWAGRANSDQGCIFSGVLGEVLGGHYGATQVQQGSRKALALLGALRPETAGESGADPAAVLAQLRIRELDRPWYLHPDVEADRRGLAGRFNDDIEADLARLRGRGIATSSQLLEAFITEHRGVQYIAAQNLSARLETDVAMPFACAPLLALASRIPAHLKIHNRVNRALTRAWAPTLTDFPTAATLVPASWPLLAQEGSRAARRAIEEGRWQLYVRTRGRIPRPRFGWVDFEFLRDGSALRAVTEELQAPLWDRGAFQRLIERVTSYAWRGGLHPVFDQMGKIMTVDRWLR